MTSAFQTHIFRTTSLRISVAIILSTQYLINAVAGESAMVTENLMANKRLSELYHGHHGDGPYCNIQGKQIPHGHTYSTSKCVKSKCFMGIAMRLLEGCEDSQGRCHGVNSQWQEKCITFQCTKTSFLNYSFLKPTFVKASCKDYYGSCHQPGKVFSLRPGSRCMCRDKTDATSYTIIYDC